MNWKSSQRKDMPLLHIAGIFEALRETDIAIELCEKVFKERDLLKPYLKVEPGLDSLLQSRSVLRC